MMAIFARLVATGFGTGFLPKAPGTWGTLVALPLIYLQFFQAWSGFFSLLVWFLLFAIGVWSTREYCKITGNSDPKEVVIDEIVAFYLFFVFRSFLNNGPNISAQDFSILVGVWFIIFRIFDAWKPSPIRNLDRFGKKFKAGTWAQALFVHLDDLMAIAYPLVLAALAAGIFYYANG